MDPLFGKPLILESKARPNEQVVSVKQISHTLWAREEHAYVSLTWRGGENFGLGLRKGVLGGELLR